MGPEAPTENPCVAAGGPGKPEGMNDGYYVKPTVFADVNNQMEIARTEIFGPVLSVIPFETEEEAIEIANDTDYGLTNYIQSQDSEKIRRLARKLRSGMVDVNGAGIAVDAPFGGFKHSGIGREAGKEGKPRDDDEACREGDGQRSVRIVVTRLFQQR